jgi:hypothetical protein
MTKFNLYAFALGLMVWNFSDSQVKAAPQCDQVIPFSNQLMSFV